MQRAAFRGLHVGDSVPTTASETLRPKGCIHGRWGGAGLPCIAHTCRPLAATASRQATFRGSSLCAFPLSPFTPRAAHTQVAYLAEAATDGAVPMPVVSVDSASQLEPGQAPPGISIDEFEIIKPISRGAFGRVYLARKKATRDLPWQKVRRRNYALHPPSSSLLLAALSTLHQPLVDKEPTLLWGGKEGSHTMPLGVQFPHSQVKKCWDFTPALPAASLCPLLVPSGDEEEGPHPQEHGRECEQRAQHPGARQQPLRCALLLQVRMSGPTPAHLLHAHA
eukprot:43814-Chlamydomonas_euryale.AAC.1